MMQKGHCKDSVIRQLARTVDPAIGDGVIGWAGPAIGDGGLSAADGGGNQPKGTGVIGWSAEGKLHPNNSISQ